MAGLWLATVCLELFSGSEPPCWSLDAARSAAIAEMLASLQPARGILRQGLGYHGVRVELTGPSPIAATVWRGLAQIEGSERSTAFRADTGRALERHLLESGIPIIPGLVLPLLDECRPEGGGMITPEC